MSVGRMDLEFMSGQIVAMYPVEIALAGFKSMLMLVILLAVD